MTALSALLKLLINLLSIVYTSMAGHVIQVHVSGEFIGTIWYQGVCGSQVSIMERSGGGEDRGHRVYGMREYLAVIINLEIYM